MAAFLAVIVLLTIGLPLFIWMVQGAFFILEGILWVFFGTIRLLCHFYLRRQERLGKYEPAPQLTRNTSTSTRGPKAPDPTSRKRKAMTDVWLSQGDPVGVVNLRTGEVYEPAPVDDRKEQG